MSRENKFWKRIGCPLCSQLIEKEKELRHRKNPGIIRSSFQFPMDSIQGTRSKTSVCAMVENLRKAQRTDNE
jgi:hypothetical protein